MKYAKFFGLLALAAGMASAADYGRVDRLQADMARDRARMNEDIRCGRRAAVERDRADLARDQRALDAAYRDVRHDRDWR